MGRAGDKRIYAERRDYLIDAVRKRRHRIRRKAIEYKGGKCTVCGYDTCIEALEFHHFGSSEKEFGLSDKGYTRSWKRVKEELESVYFYVLIVTEKSMLANCSFPG